MLYQFKRLKSVYSVSISREHPGKSSSYSCNVYISATIKRGVRLITFEKRDNLLLDGKDPGQSVDIIMKRLGDSLYPITFKVSGAGNIIGLENSEDIQSRWLAQSEQILDKVNHAPVIKRYIDASWLNVKEKLKLQNAILKDSFIRLYLTAYGKKIGFVAYNFPEQGDSSGFNLRMVGYEGDRVLLSDTQQESKFSYNRSEYGDLLSLSCALKRVDNEGVVHHFKAEIRADSDTREIR